MNEEIPGISGGEGVAIGADFIGHVGKAHRREEEVMRQKCRMVESSKVPHHCLKKYTLFFILCPI